MSRESARAFSCLLWIAASAGGQQVPIHDQIQQVYSFQPHLLNDQQISQKSAVLDEFWGRAKAQRPAYIPGLRHELADFSNPPFFLYDGSMLLLSLSDTPMDRRIALAAIAHCDLRDLQANDYFNQVHRLATLNEDTTAAAFHVLEQPKFTVFVPQHALTLGQDFVLVYLLLPTDQNYWLAPAIERLRSEKDDTAQKSLLLLLWYAQVDAADKTISAFAADPGRSAAIRTYAQELLKRRSGIGALQRTEALVSTEASIRQKRRERLKSVSDEALTDLDNYTLLLMAKRK